MVLILILDRATKERHFISSLKDPLISSSRHKPYQAKNKTSLLLNYNVERNLGKYVIAQMLNLFYSRLNLEIMRSIDSIDRNKHSSRQLFGQRADRTIVKL